MTIFCPNCKRTGETQKPEPGSRLINLCGSCGCVMALETTKVGVVILSRPTREEFDEAKQAYLIAARSDEVAQALNALEENSGERSDAHCKPLEEPLPVCFELADLNARLKRAVEAERYEVAARLRDKIKELSNDKTT